MPAILATQLPAQPRWRTTQASASAVPGARITLIEDNHGFTCLHPDSAFTRKTVQCQAELQARTGGNTEIGRTLHPPLVQAGLAGARISPRMVCVNSGKPARIEAFTGRTFTAMIGGIRAPAVAAGRRFSGDAGSILVTMREKV